MSSPTCVTEAMTLRIDSEKRQIVEEIARARDWNLSAVIDEALDAYIAIHRWQIGHIEEGLRQAETGDFADEDEVSRAFAAGDPARL
jgi:predicted transcriptional regulator